MLLYPHRRSRELRDGWELLEPDSGVWLPAPVPGTVADVVGERPDLDDRDWTYRVRFACGPDEVLLICEGLATISDVELDGAPIAHHETAFEPLVVPLPAGGGEHELRIHFRALGPLLGVPRKPRARWRTALAASNMRWFRTQLLGRTPGIAPSGALLGPYGRVILATDGSQLSISARLKDGTGMLACRFSPDLAGAQIELRGPTGRHRRTLQAAVEIPGVAAWMPHTHGEAALYELLVEGATVGRVGFRTLSWPADWERSGFSLEINGVRVFCRGVVWTPLAPTASTAQLRMALDDIRQAGMNMVRIPGTGRYESEAFYSLCDELGILVWQDLMLANFDYPIADRRFAQRLRSEFRSVLGRLAGRPSLAVVCGGSEVAQQVAMLGLDPGLARGPLYMELIPEAIAAEGVDAAYVPNSPWGDGLPFRPQTGVANYYGVGGYRRPLKDARLASVGFAAECLALANLSDHARPDDWVPRDATANWDFGQVRDHYLALLHEVDPQELRRRDPERYLALSRRVSGEVMAEVFGEWRRADASCAGGLILWSRDLRPGSGWGIWDERGRRKPLWWHLRRALAPTAVWLTDEGLAGIAVHVAHDRPGPLEAQLRVSAYRDGEVKLAEATHSLSLSPHSAFQADVEALLSRFLDINYSYRFGPPTVDLVVATLTAGGEVVSQAFRHPLGPPRRRETAAELGLEARRSGRALTLAARKLLYGVRVPACQDDDFCLEPGSSRRLQLQTDGPVKLTALNLIEVLVVS